MEPISRSDAKAAGVKTYFTGKPCRKGHICERYVSGWSCIACNRQNGVDWVAENNELKLASERKRYRADPERFKAKNKTPRARAYGKRWYQENKARVLAQTAARHKANPEKKRAKSKERYQRFPDKSKEKSRNDYARRKGADGTHTAQEVKELLRRQGFRCANPLCKANIRESFHEDHIIPLIVGGTNWIRNIQLLCAPCNLSKGRKDPLEWSRQNGMLL